MSKYQDYENQLCRLSIELGNQLKRKGLRIACVESCTGGLLSKSLTDIAGSSSYFDRGFIAYSNQAKEDMLCVEPSLIEQNGAVSEAVVKQMALSALKLSSVDLVIAISGITGPHGGTVDKPVGTVWFCCINKDNKLSSVRRQFEGDRELIRLKSVSFAIELILTDFI